MPKYLIEREIPGAGAWTPAQRQRVAEKSSQVVRELGPDIQWVESYISGDRVFCVYIAKDERLLHEHAARGGFPANRIVEIRGMLDPTHAEA